MKKITTKIRILVLFCCISLASCGEWLNVVPDMTATIDNAFANRQNAERFLHGIYNMIPNQNDPRAHPGHLAGSGEIWWNMLLGGQHGSPGARIARGEQNASSVIQNYWDGGDGGRNLWIGIRDAHIFLNNIHLVPDITELERLRWISEAKFIKAYLHFFLMKLYGPIPIIDREVPVDAPTDEVRVFRDPICDVVEFIVNTIDDAMYFLPLRILNTQDELGRVTRPAAAAVKAHVLVWAASPLFNGNPNYVNFVDSRGVHLFPTAHDNTKWERALVAIDEAIEMAHDAGHELFRFVGGTDLLPVTEAQQLSFSLRGAVTERPEHGNMEPIWAHPARNETNSLQRIVSPLWSIDLTDVSGRSEFGTTMQMAELFHTKNGVPIDEDRNWDFAGRFQTRRDTGTFHACFIRAGEVTANLHFYREPRFYSSIGFDRGYFESWTPSGGVTSFMLNNFSGQVQGVRHNNAHIMTGFFIKKLVSLRTATTGTSPSIHRFTLPNIRLADLYLLRAEAANEVQAVPNSEVWDWIDKVRERAGLAGVVESWENHSVVPGRPLTQEGMREIIRRERMIELAFEGHRPFDLRRWRLASRYMSRPAQGWDFQASTVEEYYRVMTIFPGRTFSMRDYLWPLQQSTLVRNHNLVQNPGW